MVKAKEPDFGDPAERAALADALETDGRADEAALLRADGVVMSVDGKYQAVPKPEDALAEISMEVVNGKLPGNEGGRRKREIQRQMPKTPKRTPARVKPSADVAGQPVTEPPPVIDPLFPLGKIRTDGGTQTRVATDTEVVTSYREAIESGEELPPVVVFYDGENHWLSDGFHRRLAYQAAGRDGIPAIVKEGTRRDAVLHSAGSNSTHGLRRTNEDKRKSVEMLLADPEWSQWSNREIARQCAVREKLVRTIRGELSASRTQMDALPDAQGQADAPAGRVPLDPPPMDLDAQGTASTPAPDPEPAAPDPESLPECESESLLKPESEAEPVPEAVPEPPPPVERKVVRGGSAYMMNTSGIGKSKAAKPAAPGGRGQRRKEEAARREVEAVRREEWVRRCPEYDPTADPADPKRPREKDRVKTLDEALLWLCAIAMDGAHAAKDEDGVPVGVLTRWDDTHRVMDVLGNLLTDPR
jgi:hypothetical protein